MSSLEPAKDVKSGSSDDEDEDAALESRKTLPEVGARY